MKDASEYVKTLSILIVITLTFTGCQNRTPLMSFSEASRINANFNINKLSHSPRDLGVFKQELGEIQALPKHCSLIQAGRDKEIDQIIHNLDTFQQLEQASLLVFNLAEESMVTGNYQKVLSLIDKAINKLSILDKPTDELKAALISQSIRIHAALGNITTAEAQIENLTTAVSDYQKAYKKWTYEELRYDRGFNLEWRGENYINAAKASISFSKGQLELAEHYYRKAIYRSIYNVSQIGITNSHQLRSHLIRILIQQGRLTESELVAIDTINALITSKNMFEGFDKKVYQTAFYNGTNAGPISMMALIYLKQGRIEDAQYFSKVALNMHEVGCSRPDSLGLNQARSIHVRVLAQQEKWPEILQQITLAKNALANEKQFFAQLFSQNLDYAEAEINSGNLEVGKNLLDLEIQRRIQEQGHRAWKDPEVSVIQGLLALAHSKSGQHLKAIELFASSFQHLNQASDTRLEINIEGKKNRILSGYIKELLHFYTNGIENILWIDIPGELLKVASASQSSKVNHALLSTRIRNTNDNKKLSSLIRQQQNLEQEAEALSENLAQLKFARGLDITSYLPVQIKNRLEEITSANIVLKKEILDQFPQYSELISPQPMLVSDIKNHIKSNQALIVYYVKQEHTLLWLVRSYGAIQLEVLNIGKDKISQLVSLLRKSVDPQILEKIKDIPEFDLQAAHQLYNHLLQPVSESLDGVTELLVVPDGQLSTLPFSLLVTEKNKPIKDKKLLFEKYRQTAWLARQFSVVQLPSINTLREISYLSDEERNKEKKPFIGFGDPYFDRKQFTLKNSQLAQTRSSKLSLLRGLLPVHKNKKEDTKIKIDISVLPRLPDTRDEILSIAKALNADLNSDVYFGENAKEENVLNRDLSDYRVISFATHGLIPGDLNGLYEPALALSHPDISNSKGDGLLTATEILGMNLSADIAVLSACNTAAGDGVGAESISGLGRSFFYAGAKSILVSNWPVHSAATNTLMTNLFTHLANDKNINRSEALRKTQMEMVHELGYEENGKLAFSYAHPIFWAPFTLVGDGGNN